MATYSGDNLQQVPPGVYVCTFSRKNMARHIVCVLDRTVGHVSICWDYVSIFIYKNSNYNKINQISYTMCSLSFIEWYFPLVFSLMEEEKESDAVPYLERALSVDPDNTEAQSLLFQIQSKPPPIVWVSRNYN